MYRVRVTPDQGKIVFRYEGDDAIIRPKLNADVTAWLYEHAGDRWDVELITGRADDRITVGETREDGARAVTVLNVVGSYAYLGKEIVAPLVAFVKKKDAEAFEARWL